MSVQHLSLSRTLMTLVTLAEDNARSRAGAEASALVARLDMPARRPADYSRKYSRSVPPAELRSVSLLTS